MVKALGDQFLARAALADYQYRTVERRGPARALDRVEEGKARPYELIGSFQRSPPPWANLWWQIPPYGKIYRTAIGRKLAVSTFSRVI